MWIIIGVVAGVAALGLVGYALGASRSGSRRDISTWATRLGLTYTRGTSRLFDYLRGEPFSHGYGTGIKHVATGEHAGSRVLVMVFARRAGGEARAPAVTVAVELPGAVPELTVRAESSTDAVRGRDIQLESSEFNAAFRITCDVPKFAYDVLGPQMMQFLLDDPRGRRYQLRYDGPMLVVWRDGEKVTPTELGDMLAFAHELVARTPRFIFSSGYTPSEQQTRTPLHEIPIEAFGQGEAGAIHQRRTVQHRGHTIILMDHIMDSRGIRDWFTVASIDSPTPWPTIMISPKKFLLAASTRVMIPRYNDEVLTGDQAFDEIFAVGSPRPDFVRTVLTPQMTAWLRADPRLLTSELVFISTILRPGRDEVSEVTTVGRVAVTGAGMLTDQALGATLTDLICDVVERLNPAAYQVDGKAAGTGKSSRAAG